MSALSWCGAGRCWHYVTSRVCAAVLLHWKLAVSPRIESENGWTYVTLNCDPAWSWNTEVSLRVDLLISLRKHQGSRLPWIIKSSFCVGSMSRSWFNPGICSDFLPSFTLLCSFCSFMIDVHQVQFYCAVVPGQLFQKQKYDSPKAFL